MVFLPYCYPDTSLYSLKEMVIDLRSAQAHRFITDKN
jgi:hypothetical protein